MSQPINNLKTFSGASMNTDDAYEVLKANEHIFAQNLRFTGTGQSEQTYGTNLESTVSIIQTLLPGLNNIIGGGKFDDIGVIVGFRWNSAGNCQIVQYTSSTKQLQILYTDLTNSGGVPFLPLNPQNEVRAVLLNKTFVVAWGKDLEVIYFNLNTLASGGYGSTLLWEDLSLLKPQCMIPPTGVYGNDPGQPANYLYSKLPQFIVQYVGFDYNYSACSTRSKRIVPYQENTPTLGQNVGQNNYIIVSVNIGSIRVMTTNIGCQFDDSGDFVMIKSVNNAYVLSLPNTTVNVAAEIHEAYDPATNIYSFAFYNNTINTPISATETDLPYDYIWPSNAGENINGNLIALGDFKTLYGRPATQITLGAVGYNPNIGIPAGTLTNPLMTNGSFPGATGSGAGNHRRYISINLKGTPHTNDVITIILSDIRNAANTLNYSYTVPAAQDGNLLSVVMSIAANIGGSYVAYGGGYQINFTGQPYFELTSFSVELYFAGASVANSIPTVLDNAPYQVAIAYFDYKGRYFPLCTDNTYEINTPSYAQQLGNATELILQINTANAPVGAVGYQVLITKPPITKVLDSIATAISYKGGWDAKGNSPALAINSGNVGDVYQITTPCSPTDTAHYTNLGNDATYNTGDYIVDIGGTSGGAGAGQYYQVLPKDFGNIGNAGGILVFSLNSLALLNAEYSAESVNTNLVYDYAAGDRCTLHYWIDSTGVINYFNNPCIDLAVLGYDAGTYLVKVENSSALTYSGGNIFYNGAQINARNIFLRLYSPEPTVQAASATNNETVWYEVGQQFTITNGLHNTLSIVINDGGAYYKTRQFPDALKPYSYPQINVLATDLNYSDFYLSPYHSFGRVRSYYDELENAERKASIITSEPYILGSKNNGLNRFYPANIYGDGNGQTSSSFGAIQILWQRGDILIAIQERNTFYIPVNFAYTVLNDQITGQSISEKLLNNGRYDPRGIGIGTAKESFCKRYDVGYFIDPLKAIPMEISLGGIVPISGKNTQLFKNIIKLAYATGAKMHQYYNDFYEEVILCIQAQGGIIILYPFTPGVWQAGNNYNIAGTDVTATPNGAHCTASYNSETGIVTYTPTTNYVGSDVASFSFNTPQGVKTVNNCLVWPAGGTVVNAFAFTPLTNQALSATVVSNYISVTGNTIPVPISITGGYYSVNGGAFVNTAGTVNPNDTVQVEVTTSGSNSTTTSATLTISGTSGTFSATTVAAGAGNYSVYSQYNLNISSVTNGTTTGTPAFTGFPLTNGQKIYASYTTTGGSGTTVAVVVTGNAAQINHTYLGLAVNGTLINSVMVNYPGTYYLTFTGTVNNPTTIDIYPFTM